MKMLIKKATLVLFVFAVTFTTLSACQKQTLSVPNYPLEHTAVETALVGADIPWIVTEEIPPTAEQTFYTLSDSDGKVIALISSVGKNEKRLLSIAFTPSYTGHGDYQQSLSEDNWEEVILFGTALYGGFENENQVFQDFTDHYDSKISSQIRGTAPSGVTYVYRELLEWKSEINGINCVIRMGRPDPDSSEKYLSAIYFYNANEYAPPSLEDIVSDARPEPSQN